MSEKMTVAKFLTHPVYGCGTSSEVIKFSQTNKAEFDSLKQMAREEMKNRGIEVEEILKTV
jgi:2-keto-3-deoxy-6-phosphogluconate aldolase